MKKLLIFLMLFTGLGLLQQKTFAQPVGVPLGGALGTIGANSTYPTHLDVLQKGGYRTVATIAQRDSITNKRRKAGMLVYVVDSGSNEGGKLYILAGQAEPPYDDSAPDNARWQEYATGGGGPEPTFAADLLVATSRGFGKYLQGDSIPAAGKTARQVIEDAVKLERIVPGFIAPSLSLTGTTTPSVVPPGNVEIGTAINITLLETFDAGESGGAISTTFYKNGTALASGVDNIASLTAPVSYTVSVSYAAGTKTKTDSYDEEVQNTITAGTITSTAITFTPVFKRYWGRSPVSTGIDETIVKAIDGGLTDLATNRIKNNFSIPFKPDGTLNYFYYAYPASLGDVVDNLITVGPIAVEFTKFQFNITSVGFTQLYNVYVSPNPTGGNSGTIAVP